MFERMGEATPPTQWRTLGGLLVVVTVCGARAWYRGAAGGDGVPDGDALGSDEDVFDEQAQHALPLGHGGGGRVAVQAGEGGLGGLGGLWGGLSGFGVVRPGGDVGARAGGFGA